MTFTDEFNATHARELIHDAIDDPTPLQQDVIDWLVDSADSYDGLAYDALRNTLSDLMHGGCASGIVGHLIYYSDIERYYSEHQDAIDNLAQDQADACGCSIGELFARDQWDNDDPLARHEVNRGLLCWLAFECTALDLASALDMDV